MRRLFVGLVVAAVLFVQPLSNAAPKEEAPVLPKVGDLAPDFKLQYFDGHGLKDVSLSDFRGKQQVVVAFYVFAFTGG